MTDRTIRVLVVDDNEFMRGGLCDAINLDEGMEVVGAAGNSKEALSLYKELKPDVVTMDYQMPGENGLKCTERILFEDSGANVILISVYDSEEDVWNAQQAGVRGYLTKRVSGVDLLLDAIHVVASGRTHFTGDIERKLERRRSSACLTNREATVLKLLANGRTNKDIASELGIALPTVKFHILQIRGKLGAVDRTDAVVKGFRRGILRADDEPV